MSVSKGAVTSGVGATIWDLHGGLHKVRSLMEEEVGGDLPDLIHCAWSPDGRWIAAVICAEVVKPPDRGEVRWITAEIIEGNRTPMRTNTFQSPPMVLGGPHCTSMAAGAVH